MHRSVICGFVGRKNAEQCCSDRDIWIFLGTDAFIPGIAVVTDRSLLGAGCCISVCRRGEERPSLSQAAGDDECLGNGCQRFHLALIWGNKADPSVAGKGEGTQAARRAQVALGIVPGSAGAMITLRAACPWSGV